MKVNSKVPFYKKKWFIPILIVVIVIAFYESRESSKTSSKSSLDEKESKCYDERAYDIGYKEGKNNRNANFLADCDYMWKLDNDGQMSKDCFCQGYNNGFNQ
jgi:hypothetical protein